MKKETIIRTMSLASAVTMFKFTKAALDSVEDVHGPIAAVGKFFIELTMGFAGFAAVNETAKGIVNAVEIAVDKFTPKQESKYEHDIYKDPGYRQYHGISEKEYNEPDYKKFVKRECNYYTENQVVVDAIYDEIEASKDGGGFGNEDLHNLVFEWYGRINSDITDPIYYRDYSHGVDYKITKVPGSFKKEQEETDGNS